MVPDVPSNLEIIFTNKTPPNRFMWLFMWNAMHCQVCGKYFTNKWEWQNTYKEEPKVVANHLLLIFSLRGTKQAGAGDKKEPECTGSLNGTGNYRPIL